MTAAEWRTNDERVAKGQACHTFCHTGQPFAGQIDPFFDTVNAGIPAGGFLVVPIYSSDLFLAQKQVF